MVILIVDDEPSVRKMVESMIKNLYPDAVFLHALHGDQALGVINSPGQVFDLMISDTIMPVMGGVKLVEKVRAAFPNIRIVLISGSGEPEGHMADAFVDKPFKMANLLSIVRRVMES